MISMRRPGCMALRAGLRPRVASRARLFWRETTTAAITSTTPLSAAEQTTGRLDVKADEAVLFFDNIFPLKLTFLIGRRPEAHYKLTKVLGRYNSSTLGPLEPVQLVKRAMPTTLPIEVTQIVPRLQDGGAYVKFRHDAAVSASEVEAALSKQLTEQPVTPWFNPFRRVRARLVRGTPWLEDLYRYPSSQLLVEFVPPTPGAAPPEELSPETVYGLLRRYGRISDMAAQPSDSKVTPRFVTVGFSLARDAIMARNCMYGFVVDEALGGGKQGTRLRLSYVRRARPHNAWNWMTSHPRIVIPVLAALLAGVSVLVFDPIRQFFIRLHVQQSLRYENWKLYRWLRSYASASFGGKKEQKKDDEAAKKSGVDDAWTHRRDLIEQLQGWLDGSSGTFIVVTGPRGSGKTEMVMDRALAGRRNVVYVDCKRITEGGSDTGIIKRLAATFGYRPLFSWANGISSMMDLALQSTAGVKTGFTETLDSQVHDILQTTLQALRRIALSGRTKQDRHAGMSEDGYLEAHPERRPVVVLDNYLDKKEEMALVYDKLTEWAAGMAQNNVAHVVFLTSQSSYAKPLAKAMPDRVFRTLSLSDLDQDLARNYVVSRLEELWRREAQDDEDMDGDGEGVEKAAEKRKGRPDLSGLDGCIRKLGGRLTDLEVLARRLKAGQNPREATAEIVDENATDIVKMFLLGKADDADGTTTTTTTTARQWSTLQAWQLIKALAETETLRYHQVLLRPAFAAAGNGNGEAAIDGLAGTELIAVKTHRGRPQTITAGKPLHQASFRLLVEDRVLRAKMDLAVLDELARTEAGGLAAVEDELRLLGGLPRHTGGTAGRVMYLLDKLEAAQGRIEGYEREMRALKRILNNEA